MYVFIDSFPTHWTRVVPLLNPTLYALCMEEMFLITFQLSHIILFLILAPAYYAFLFGFKETHSFYEFRFLKVLDNVDTHHLLLRLCEPSLDEEVHYEDKGKGVEDKSKVADNENSKHEIGHCHTVLNAIILSRKVEEVSMEDPIHVKYFQNDQGPSL